jgi:hypothetical protein
MPVMLRKSLDVEALVETALDELHPDVGTVANRCRRDDWHDGGLEAEGRCRGPRW